MKIYDLAIVGAGPAGIGCAISAKKRDMDVVLLEKGNIVNSIINFPSQMSFFSTSSELEIHHVPFNSQALKPLRIEAVKYYQSLISFFNIPVITKAFVKNIAKLSDQFSINYEKHGRAMELKSKKAILASGFYDNPNMLNIPGEEQDHVSHYYREPFQHYNQDVIVVGGKNSAVEAALDLHRHGARVRIIHRRNEIKESVKYWVLPDIYNRIEEGSIKVSLNSEVVKINSDTLEVKCKNTLNKYPADAVYLLTGYHPDPELLDRCGIRYHPQTLEAEIIPKTLETNIEGLYLAGSIVAGRNANKIFIENSRAHGEMILRDIENKIKNVPA
jgi:thioredoxin reductase (NADPH)